jgi:hypothetical protein
MLKKSIQRASELLLENGDKHIMEPQQVQQFDENEPDYFQVIGATSADYAFYRIGTVENMPGDSQIRLTNLALQYSGGTYPGDFDPVTIKFYESNQGALLLDETEWATAAGETPKILESCACENPMLSLIAFTSCGSTSILVCYSYCC